LHVKRKAGPVTCRVGPEVFGASVSIELVLRNSTAPPHPWKARQLRSAKAVTKVGSTDTRTPFEGGSAVAAEIRM